VRANIEQRADTAIVVRRNIMGGTDIWSLPRGGQLVKMTVVTTGDSRNELIEDVIATRCAYWDSLFAQASSQRRLASEACGLRLLTESYLRCNCCQPGNRDHPILTVLNGASRQEEPTIKHIFIEVESLRGETSQSRVA